ncbi:hypothetical protein N9051_01435 [Akkermansiaceae bacterium]|nr:hypothetical protein [Akkermansiaceae bacterium]
MLRLLLSFFLTSFLHAEISLTIRNKPTSLHRANLEARLDGAFLIRHYELVFKNLATAKPKANSSAHSISASASWITPWM